jgi:hypothetical protein
LHGVSILLQGRSEFIVRSRAIGRKSQRCNLTQRAHAAMAPHTPVRQQNFDKSECGTQN